mgnify:CR=1 FL=1|jgi:hypothetical protein
MYLKPPFPMRKTLFVFFVSVVLILASTCTRDRGPVMGRITDAELYAMCIDSSGHFWYQGGQTLPGAGNSPHGNFRLRFDSTANTVLTQMGEISPGGIFPEGSLIVKDIISNNQVELYAVMYKYLGAWLWAEYRPGGAIVHGIRKDPGICTSCHGIQPNRDWVRTFDLH